MGTRAPTFRHGSKLGYEDLCEEAARALRESEYTQEEMADELGVTRGSIAKAVTQPGTRFQKLQMRILEALTDYEIERREHVVFRTWRKDRKERD
jgi:transcriptional regulator with XRE-family HTH domain